MGNRQIKSIENMFELYIKKTGLNVLKKDSIQYIETRKAFIIGASLMFRELTIKISELSDDDAMKEIDKLNNEVITITKDI